jgi:hypothetical protein
MALQTSGQARTGITPLGVKKSQLKDNKLPFFPALHQATSELRCLKTLAGYLTVLANWDRSYRKGDFAGILAALRYQEQAAL